MKINLLPSTQLGTASEKLPKSLVKRGEVTQQQVQTVEVILISVGALQTRERGLGKL